MGVRVVEADRADGHEVGAPAELTQDGEELHRPAGRIVDQRHLLDPRVQRQPARVGGVVHLAEGIDEPVEAVEAGELRPTEVGAGRPVQVGRLRHRQLLPAGVPQLLDEPGVEVAERAARHGCGRVAEHAAAPEEVQAHAVDAALLATRGRLRDEVERAAEGGDLRACLADDLVGCHGRRH